MEGQANDELLRELLTSERSVAVSMYIGIPSVIIGVIMALVVLLGALGVIN